MTADDARADLAYVRELAESGHRAPLLGGRFLAWWGGLATGAFLTHWMIWTGVIAISSSWLGALWLGFIFIGSAGTWVLSRSVESKPGAGSIGNRAQSAVWPVIGGCLMVYYLAIMTGALTGRLDPGFYNTMLPMGFFGYAIGWLTSAVIVRSVRLAVPGVISLAGMYACMLMVTTAEVYLVAAATMAASTFIPGLLMMRAEPRDVV
jgi:hypothetical protein